MEFSACPAPILDHKTIVLGHGSGGRLTHQLIQKMILPAFRNPALETQHDGAVFAVKEGRLAFSADSYVVHPIFFPGGNIGDLAVNGTVNDLSMCGATPQYLSASFIIEEGLAMDDLWRIVRSMRDAADATRLEGLTERETEVLRLVGQGLTDDEIAQRLYLSPLTAKTHVNRIMAKLDVRDRAQLVVVAYQTGFAYPKR